MARIILLASVVWVLSCCGLANAATINFNTLPGPNMSPFTTFSEAGFTVTTTAGSPQEGTVFGNPEPSIIIAGPVFSPVTGAVQVTRMGGGDFTFSSVDLASNNGPDSTFLITGLLDGHQQFRFPNTGTGTVTSGPNGMGDYFFTTEINPHNTTPIDALDISVSPGSPDVTSDNLDNIVVDPVQESVSEPSTMVLLVSALCIGAVALRRRAPRWGQAPGS